MSAATIARRAVDLLLLGRQVGLDDKANVRAVAAEVMPHRPACRREPSPLAELLEGDVSE